MDRKKMIGRNGEAERLTAGYLNVASGLIDEVKLYAAALSEQEIGDYYRSVSVPAIEFGAVSDKMLLIQTDFADDKEMSGYFILVPDEESDEKILHALGF